MNTHIFNNARYAIVAAALITALGVMSFFAFEPKMGWAQIPNPHDFVVSTTVQNEIAFLVEANDVTMVGTITGLTGGYATGTTRVSVNTNNATGYNMTLQFADAGSTGNAMQASSSAYINNYSPATPGTADFAWVTNSSGGAGEFGYTVRASTTGEVSSRFMNNSTICGTGSTETDDRCWFSPTTTAADVIVNSDAPAVGGSSTSTIKFKIAVPSNPSPALPSGIYFATGTLTATTN